MLTQLFLSLVLFLTAHGLVFETNMDQAPADVRYLLRTDQYQLDFKRGEMVLHTGNEALRIQFSGNLNRRVPEGAGRMNGLIRYIEADEKEKAKVPQFSSVRYESLYMGIDFTCHGRNSRLECDFAAMPNGNPNEITLTVYGDNRLIIDESGALTVELSGKPLRLQKPTAFQLDRGQRNLVQAEYRLIDSHNVGFVIGQYKHSIPLIIDLR